MSAALGRALFVAGLVLAAAGLALWAAARWHLPLGRLPGDLRFRRGGTTIYFPWVTMLLLSLVLSLLLRLGRR